MEDDVFPPRRGEAVQGVSPGGDGGFDDIREPAHELVLEMDQQGLLVGIRVVERGRLNVRGVADGAHRGGVAAEPEKRSVAARSMA
ncbi:hypothetical protein AB0929_29680 [Streptomyces massasporeus]|uniref:hypothetical protein n=1 Tax=Streptomyces massasporeus TaxID=67324 RepID=UPI003455FD93